MPPVVPVEFEDTGIERPTEPSVTRWPLGCLVKIILSFRKKSYQVRHRTWIIFYLNFFLCHLFCKTKAKITQIVNNKGPSQMTLPQSNPPLTLRYRWRSRLILLEFGFWQSMLIENSIVHFFCRQTKFPAVFVFFLWPKNWSLLFPE